MCLIRGSLGRRLRLPGSPAGICRSLFSVFIRLVSAILWISVAVAASAGCHGERGPTTTGDPDAGGNAALEIVSPGESIGLAFGGSATLRVRYLAPNAAPAANTAACW